MTPRLTLPTGRIALSTSSVYPLGVVDGFAMAERLGYDGVEVMVWTDPVSREAGALRKLVDHYGIPIVSVHAPTLLLTQRIWGPEPWPKIDNSIALAEELGAHTVLVHPPFRWEREYPVASVDGIAERGRRTQVRVAVENMFPWRARGREMQAYLPGWDPVGHNYDHVTLDLSHTATAGSDAIAMADALGDRLTHLHLADGSGSFKDEHLVPGRGRQPCARVLESLAARGYTGDVVVEVGTRKLSGAQRELDLAEALAFARLHFAAAA